MNPSEANELALQRWHENRTLESAERYTHASADNLANFRAHRLLPITYLICSGRGGPVKIGHSTVGGLRQNIAGLQRGNPKTLELLTTFVGGEPLERALQDQFAHLHVRGEWFEPDDDLLALVPSR